MFKLFRTDIFYDPNNREPLWLFSLLINSSSFFHTESQYAYEQESSNMKIRANRFP